MRDVPKAAALIRAVVEATGIPVGVKMRLGVDSGTRNAPALAEAAERAGAAFLTVHGRTPVSYTHLCISAWGWFDSVRNEERFKACLLYTSRCV